MFTGKFTPKDKEANLAKLLDLLNIDFNHVAYGEITGDYYEHIDDIPLSRDQVKFLLGENTKYLTHFKVPNEESVLDLFINVDEGQFGLEHISKITYAYQMPLLPGTLEIVFDQGFKFSHSNEVFEEALNSNEKLMKLINRYFLSSAEMDGVLLISDSFLKSFNEQKTHVFMSNLPLLTETGIYLHPDISIDILNLIYEEILKL